MNRLAAGLRALIAADGPITFAEFMRVALYDPDHGYYAAGAQRTGREGDYMTAPELDPAFGELWARGLDEIWAACGRPDEFDLVELGPGEGGLLIGLLAASSEDLRRALRVTLVEPSVVRRGRDLDLPADVQPRWVGDVAEVGPIAAGCVLANEVLDNQPVHVVRSRDGRLEELHVALDGSELIESWLPCHNPDLMHRAAVRDESDRAEVSLDAEQLVETCVSAIGKGAAIFIDYGKRGGPVDTLVSYSASGAAPVDLNQPGMRDITAHVDWDAIAAVCIASGANAIGPFRQTEVLRRLGARAYDEALRAAHEDALAHKDGAGAVRLLSRRQSLRALLDPGGLGGLDVLIALKGIPAPAFAQEKDRPAGRSS